MSDKEMNDKQLLLKFFLSSFPNFDQLPDSEFLIIKDKYAEEIKKLIEISTLIKIIVKRIEKFISKFKESNIALSNLKNLLNNKYYIPFINDNGSLNNIYLKTLIWAYIVDNEYDYIIDYLTNFSGDLFKLNDNEHFLIPKNIQNDELKNLLIEMESIGTLNNYISLIDLIEPGNKYNEYQILQFIKHHNSSNGKSYNGKKLYQIYLKLATKYKIDNFMVCSDRVFYQEMYNNILEEYIEIKFIINEIILYNNIMDEDLYELLKNILEKEGLNKLKNLLNRLTDEDNIYNFLKNIIQGFSFEESCFFNNDDSIETKEKIIELSSFSKEDNYMDKLSEAEIVTTAIEATSMDINDETVQFSFGKYKKYKNIFKILLKKDIIFHNRKALDFVYDLLENNKDINFIDKALNLRSLYIYCLLRPDASIKEYIKIALDGANNVEEFINRLDRVLITTRSLHNIENNRADSEDFYNLNSFPPFNKESIVDYKFQVPKKEEGFEIKFIMKNKINMEQVDTRRVMEAYLHPAFFLFLNNFYKLKNENIPENEYNTDPEYIKYDKKYTPQEEEKYTQIFFFKKFKNECKNFGIDYLEFLEDLFKLNECVKNKKITQQIKQKVLKIYTNLDVLYKFTFVKRTIQKAEPKKIPDLNFKIDDYTFEVLPDKSLEHLTIGVFTDCCQRLGGPGELAAIDSLINPLAGVLVLYNKNRQIISQSYFHYVPSDNGIILDNVETNRSLARNVDIDSLYANLALHLKSLGFNYVKCGINYNKLNNSKFTIDKDKEDPRTFNVENPYTDYDYKKHLDLTRPTFDFEKKDVVKLAINFIRLLKLSNHYLNIIK